MLIQKEDRWKATFRCKYRVFEPIIMFFGLMNSPAAFQRFMTHMLADFIEQGWLLVYMDDILIYSTDDIELHHARTLKVLQ